MPTKHTTVRLSDDGKARLLRLSKDSQAETIEEALEVLEERRSAWWGGEIGVEARAALSVMALEDAIAAQIEQQEAAERLVGRLILEERARRIQS
jgi:hypothetical protein